MAVDAVFGGSVGRQDIAILGISQVNGNKTYCGRSFRCSLSLVEATEVQEEGVVVVGGDRACGRYCEKFPLAWLAP